MQTLRLAGLLTLRDWRTGELRLLLLALLLAVTSLSSVGFLVDRTRQALARDAAQLLGADLVMVSDRAVNQNLLEEASQNNLSVSQTLNFPSMALAPQASEPKFQLSSIKVVDSHYPLRGRLQISRGVQEPLFSVTAEALSPGSVWIDPSLLPILGLNVGDNLQLGEGVFKIDALLIQEPDRGMSFINFAPRVMLRLEDLERTKLVTVGSRVSYRLLVSGNTENVSKYNTWLQGNLQKGQRIESLSSGRPEMRQTLDRAQQFLSLVALLAAFVAAVAVALAAQRFMLRRRQSVAIMRCLGARSQQLILIFGIEFFIVALGGSILGTGLGYLVHYVLLAGVATLWVTVDLPAPSWLPGIQSLLAGMWLLLSFALPPMIHLPRVAPVHVLRQTGIPLLTGNWVYYLVGMAGFSLLLIWFIQDIKLGVMVIGGLLGALGIFALVSWLLLKSLEPLRYAQRGVLVLRFALASLVRRKGATVAQLCALALGLLALLLLSLIRNDLIDGWQRTIPPNAPNRFLINIQPDQRAAVLDQLQLLQRQMPNPLARSPATLPTLYPMVRGRLVKINQQAVDIDAFEDARARRLLDREFNLSYMDELPAHNRLVAGQWLNLNEFEVSMEQGIAQSLELKLGDKLTFEIGGQAVTVIVSSLRKLDWDSMQANFFAILTPLSLKNTSQSFMTALFVSPDQEAALYQLIEKFPNLTIIDTTAILRQAQTILTQVSSVVQFLFLFTLISGALVLYAALVSTYDERCYEAGLLRALGASSHQLRWAQFIELSLIGALAGLLAALAASAVGAWLAISVFNFSWTVNPWVFVLGIAGGITCVLAAGWLALRRVLVQSPMVTLRAV